MAAPDILSMDSINVMATYGKRSIALVRGSGARVWDADGKEYLDLLTGLAVASLGHCHPRVVAAIREQAGQLAHVSNLYAVKPQAALAQLLVDHSFADRVFFCNSGAEANEAAIKLARKYAKKRAGVLSATAGELPAESGEMCEQGPYEIITMSGCFHGRTLATITATAQSKFHRGFAPLAPGFRYAPFNDLEAVKRAVSEKTAAVMVEPIQGEGGDNIATEEFLKGLRELTGKRGLTLILDEVQTGLGRTGRLFAYEHYGIEPDMMTLAKPLGGGLPLGAMLARQEVADAFEPGDHASTFGGNPVCCAAGLATLETILEESLVERAAELGGHLAKRLEALREKHALVKEVRARGLMAGIELDRPGKDIVARCADRGLLINCTAVTFIRFLPPLTVTREELDRGVEILDGALAEENG